MQNGAHRAAFRLRHIGGPWTIGKVGHGRPAENRPRTAHRKGTADACRRVRPFVRPAQIDEPVEPSRVAPQRRPGRRPSAQGCPRWRRAVEDGSVTCPISVSARSRRGASSVLHAPEPIPRSRTRRARASECPTPGKRWRMGRHEGQFAALADALSSTCAEAPTCPTGCPSEVGRAGCSNHSYLTNRCRRD